MKNLLFPYDEVRKLQKALMLQVDEAIKNKHSLIIHAPTGIGKTAAALSPALSNALEKNLTVFFLTSRHTQHKIAIETLSRIKEKYKTSFVVVDLVGKKWMCNQAGVSQLSSSEFGDYCKDLKKKDLCEFFLNLKSKNKLTVVAQKTLGDLEKKSPLPVEAVSQICFGNKVCCYETSCLLAKKAKVVIVDYNHLLNPSIMENLLKRADKKIDDAILIFDEAHNIADRTRKILSQNISTITLELAAKEAKILGFDEVANILQAVKELILKMVRDKISIEETECLVKKMDFYQPVDELVSYEQLCGDLRFIAEQVVEQKKRSFCSSVANFLESWSGPDEGFARILAKGFTKYSKPFVSLNYKCLDPSLLVKDLVKKSHSSIFMSGTLTPATMYCELFDLDKEKTITVEYDNPFPKQNRLSIIIPETSTKYATRGKEMYQLISEKCSELISNIPGNILMFFPSYTFRDEIYRYLKSSCTKTVFLERSGLSKEEKAELLERFKSYKNAGAVLIGVSAGSFSEGIDLPGDLLNAVIIIGLPLTKPDLETKELISYYDKKFGRGWDYAYLYPAIIKCTQGAGRCIRSETDRGAVILLDERYAWKRYFECFPKDWPFIITKEPIKIIKEFFEQKKD
ncbi:ATP-dependent DNA helicase [Candidatus Woesearchaeota archaeon]|nr:ATP-dependent DNA helicase [Candidatus Woesearchaeota archaeon]